MIVKTDGFVLKRIRYNDSSKILTLYTKEFGVLKAIAKGSRSLNNKFGSALEPLTHTHFVIYKKDQRDIQLISSADVLHSYRTIRNDLNRLSCAYAVAEVFLRVIRHQEKQDALYDLLLGAYQELDEARSHPRAVLRAFQIRMAGLMGFRLQFDTCVTCGRELHLEEYRLIKLDADKGGLACPECFGKVAEGLYVSDTMGRYWRERKDMLMNSGTAKLLLQYSLNRFESLPPEPSEGIVGNELDEAIRLYMETHFGEWRPLGSLSLQLE